MPPAAMLRSHNLIEAFYHFNELIGGRFCQASSDSLNSQSPDLTDLHPRSLGQAFGFQLKSERKAGPLWLTGKGYSNHRSRSFIEDVVAQYQDRAQP